MRRHYNGEGFGHPLAMLVFAAVIIGLAALAAYLVVRASRRSQLGAPPASHPVGPPAAGDGALDLARMRYARGELTRDAYVQVVADLGGPPPPAPPPAPDASS